MLTRLIGENVRVELALSSAPCFVRVDPAHIEQVVLNLAINARDATPDGGTFRVETRLFDVDRSASPAWGNADAGPYVELIASDSGHGMPPDVQSRVFEPFFTTKDVGKGTGLGLSTMYDIVAQSGGYIRVASEVNRGTRRVIRARFTFWSPTS